MDNLSKDWLIGFIEGEGNFHVSLSKAHKWCSFEFYPILQFRIFLREDDVAVLEHIKNTIGVGNIYRKNYDYSRKKGVLSQDQCEYSISKMQHLLKLREFLKEGSFHTKKKADMEKFFQILDLKLSKEHLTKEGYEKIVSIANTMNSQRRNDFKVKRLNE